nr:hypothetical protein GCM10017611_03160 [Rhodococcus wratislaviensis]
MAWSACVSTLRGPEVESNPVVAVGVEVDGVGNLDDVVVYRESPPNTYIQVKYTVDSQHPVNGAYLTDPSKAGGPSILEKIYTAWKDLSTSGDPAELVLMTNRAPDPEDPLVSGRDARTRLLLPNANEGGPASKKGVARQQWTTAAKMRDGELTQLLEVLRFDLAHDVKHVEEKAGLQMLASGLRGDPDAVAAGIGWVEQQVIAGKRRITADDISDAVARLGLRQGQSRSILSIATLTPDPLAAEAAHHLDWVDRFDGVDAPHKRRPLPPATWEQLQDDIEAIPSHLVGATHVIVTGSMRLPTAFTVGATLRMVTNVDLAVVQRQDLWSTDTSYTEAVTPRISTHQIGQGNDLAIVVQIAAPVHEDVLRFITEQQLPVDKLLAVSPPGGVNDKAISGSSAANALAFGIRNALRPQVRRYQSVHLFLATPMGFALLLGHRWNAMGPTTVVYEDLVHLGYERAFTISA